MPPIFKRLKLAHQRLLLFVYAFFAIIVVLAATGLAIHFFVPQMLSTYVLVIAIPTLLAHGTVAAILVLSGYFRLAYELGWKRRNQLSVAGLAFVKSSGNRVLLNFQVEPPWQHMWILPGGYFNRAKGDRDPHDTAARRFREIANVAGDWDAVAEIAETNLDDPEYVLAMIDSGHSPTQDHIYLVQKGRDAPNETDIIETNALRWWSVDDIVDGRVNVPPHMHQIVLFLANNKGSAQSRIRFWSLSESYSQYYLNQLH